MLPPRFLDAAAVDHRALLLVLLPVLLLALSAAVVALLAGALELTPGGTAVFAELWVWEEVRHVDEQGLFRGPGLRLVSTPGVWRRRPREIQGLTLSTHSFSEKHRWIRPASPVSEVCPQRTDPGVMGGRGS